ncbi:MAG: aconitase X catalytic domain-containing protein [Candidatus Bathyarchaeia archaeon]
MIENTFKVKLLYLTNEEEKMLRGDYGPGVQKAMEILTAIGDLNDAKRMISISSAHMAGNYGVLREEGVEWLEWFAESAKVKVFTSVNPQGFDFDLWREMDVPETFRRIQLRIDNALKRLGVKLFYTCQQFLVGNLPKKGEHIAWAASETEIFANSVLGAMTNREGDHSALAAAVVGKTPEYGMHLPENRVGNILVDVGELDFCKLTQTDYAAIGYYVGKVVGDKIPVFVGLPKDISLQNLQALAYPLPVSGAVPMFHLVGITPEAPTIEAAFGGDKPEDKITVATSDIKRVYEESRRTTKEKVDLVIFGCPHCTLQEIEEIAAMLSGRKVFDGVKLWVCTSKSTKVIAERMGYGDVIRSAGGMLIADTCPSGGPYAYLKEKGVEVVVTNSLKAAYYAYGLFGMGTIFASTKDCVEAAIKGRWER